MTRARQDKDSNCLVLLTLLDDELEQKLNYIGTISTILH
jgi:hypothetical protein